MSETTFDMSKHTENCFFGADSMAFDIDIHVSGNILVSEWNYSNVNYSDWILYWNNSPGGILLNNGEKKYLDENLLALIPPYTTFSTMCTKPFRHFFLHFRVPAPFDRVRRNIYYFQSVFAANCMKNLNNSTSKIYRALTIRIFVFEYLRRIPENAFLPVSEPTMDPRIKHALELMEQDLAQTLDNRRLAKKIGMSLNNFYRCFFNETGTSPSRYLLSLRMASARNLLLYSKLSVDEIAFKTGYADRCHFSKAFRNFYGLPPVTYRDKALGNHL